MAIAPLWMGIRRPQPEGGTGVAKQVQTDDRLGHWFYIGRPHCGYASLG
jgi:hypothetical protein